MSIVRPWYCRCAPCLKPGAECPANTSFAKVRLLSGHWRLSNRSRTIYPCLTSVNGSACVGGDTVGDDGSSYCLAGHTGPLCQVCDRASGPAYFDKSIGRCKACPELSTKLPLPIALVSVLALLALLGRIAWANPPARFREFIANGRRIMIRVKELDLAPRFKVRYPEPLSRRSAA